MSFYQITKTAKSVHLKQKKYLLGDMDLPLRLIPLASRGAPGYKLLIHPWHGKLKNRQEADFLVYKLGDMALRRLAELFELAR
jgi:hypothetical protein